MATRKSSGKSTGKKNYSTRKKNTKSRRNQDNGIRLDIIVLVILAVAIILFISNFNLAGSVGNVIGDFTKGLFGVMSYPFPLVLFFGFAFYAVNRNNHQITRKMIGIVLTFIFMCALFQLFIAGVDVNDTIGSFYTASREGYIAGGLVGGLVVFIFSKPFGAVGAYILSCIGFIISVIIMTQKPIVRNLSKLSSARIARANMRRKERAEELRTIREENRRLAEEHERLSMELMLDEVDERIYEPKPVRRRKNNNEIEGVFDLKRVNTSGNDTKKANSVQNIDVRKPQSGSKNLKRNLTNTDIKSILDPSELRAINQSSRSILDEAEDNTVVKLDEMPSIRFNDYTDKTENDDIVIEGFNSNVKSFDEHSEIHDVTELRFDDNLDIVESEIKPKKTRSVSTGKASSGSDMSKEGAKAVDKEKKEDNKAVNVDGEIAENLEVVEPEYEIPSPRLLTKMNVSGGDSQEYLLEMAEKLRKTLQDFGVNVKITNVSRGPAVTRYELEPEHGVKVSKIVSLTDDIKLNLAAADIRIEAPIPGKAAIGIEVPNKENTAVPLRDMIESNEFKNAKSKLSFTVGRDIAGKPIISDIKKMPHLLIAGATGSGKSVCINTLIMSILFKAKPEEVRMILIDPKVVELSIYNGIPHLLLPVVTDPKQAAGALNWAVKEMNDRYKKFSEYVGIRDLTGYNAKIKQLQKDITLTDEEKAELKVLPQILIIVDELADLMMVAPADVEQSICRITQLARAAGIHLVVATQRPSVNVITGLIKANMPSRIAFAVSSGVDSRTILDMNGAERLLGKGDMLFYPQGYPKPLRVQGSFVSDEDVAHVVEFINGQSPETKYDQEIEKQITESASSGDSGFGGTEGKDEYFWDAAQIIIDKDKASIGMLQRFLKIGFNRAARIMDQLSEEGIVGPEEGTKPRQILISKEKLESMMETDA